MTFAIWGDEIAYAHITVGKITIPPTTLRDRLEADLLGVDPEAVERQISEAIEENRQEWSDKVDELEGENADLKIDVKRLERALDAIDGGATAFMTQLDLIDGMQIKGALFGFFTEAEARIFAAKAISSSSTSNSSGSPKPTT